MIPQEWQYPLYLPYKELQEGECSLYSPHSPYSPYKEPEWPANTPCELSLSKDLFAEALSPISASDMESDIEKDDDSSKKQLYPIDKQLLEQSEAGKIFAVKSLLLKKANPNVRDQGGETPLHKAASKGHSMTIAVLLKFKAIQYMTTPDGKTPMTYAIKSGYLQTVKILIESGYHVDYQNANYSKQRTPLEDACAYQFIHITRYLLAQGASITDKILFKAKTLPMEIEGKTQSEMVDVPCKKSINYLIKAGGNINKILKLAEDKIDHYCTIGKMNPRIWAKFVKIEKRLLRLKTVTEPRKPRKHDNRPPDFVTRSGRCVSMPYRTAKFT